MSPAEMYSFARATMPAYSAGLVLETVVPAAPTFSPDDFASGFSSASTMAANRSPARAIGGLGAYVCLPADGRYDGDPILHGIEHDNDGRPNKHRIRRVERIIFGSASFSICRTMS